MQKVLLGLVLGFLVSLTLMPLIIKLMKKFQCSQTILKYVEEHKSKQGTATMGGVVFFLSTILVVFFLLPFDKCWFVVFLVGLSFALLGGMDDFIKIKFKRNLGLRPYQKIIGQTGIAIILALYVYFNVGTSIYIPFINRLVDIGFAVIPLVFLTSLATTNSVNLTDGLDGLAGSVSVVVSGVTIAILYILSKGNSLISSENIISISVLLSIFMGSILGFLIFNTNKASIFMGDVGSLGIGGVFSAVFCLTGLEFSLIFLGAMFVVSAVSVILQVFSFKVFHKRIFKMAPLHHHFQQSGFSEAKITFSYSIITLILGLILIMTYL